MAIPLFDPSFVFAILLSIGIFLIPSLCVAVWTSVLFFLIEKIPQKWLKMIVPVSVALVFSVGDIPFQSFMYATLRGNEFLMSGPLMGIVHLIPYVTILAVGVITTFLVIRDHLTLKRAWHAIFAASAIAVTYIFSHNFFIAMGPLMGTYADISGIPYIGFLTQFSQFLEAVVIAAAVFGAIMFLQDISRLVGSPPRKRWILLAAAGSLLVFLPAAAIGGLAVFFRTVLEKIPGRLIPMGISVAAMAVAALAGTMHSGISGLEMVIDFAIITTVIMALAMLVPFLYIALAIGKDWQSVILLAGTVTADLVLSMVAVELDLGERLTSDPAAILTFAAGGMIIAACTYAAGHFLVTNKKKFVVTRSKG